MDETSPKIWGKTGDGSSVPKWTLRPGNPSSWGCLVQGRILRGCFVQGRIVRVPRKIRNRNEQPLQNAWVANSLLKNSIKVLILTYSFIENLRKNGNFSLSLFFFNTVYEFTLSRCHRYVFFYQWKCSFYVTSFCTVCVRGDLRLPTFCSQSRKKTLQLLCWHKEKCFAYLHIFHGKLFQIGLTEMWS
jgi:hypothetical protein